MVDKLCDRYYVVIFILLSCFILKLFRISLRKKKENLKISYVQVNAKNTYQRLRYR